MVIQALASRLAWYFSYYADNPNTLVLLANNLYALATGFPIVQYSQQIGHETAHSQDTDSPIESQMHSMTGDFEDDISKAEATKRGQEFGWKNIFKAAESGTPDQYEKDSKEDKAFGVGIYALQDSKSI